jgi:hypothetical protein
MPASRRVAPRDLGGAIPPGDATAARRRLTAAHDRSFRSAACAPSRPSHKDVRTPLEPVRGRRTVPSWTGPRTDVPSRNSTRAVVLSPFASMTPNGKELAPSRHRRGEHAMLIEEPRKRTDHARYTSSCGSSTPAGTSHAGTPPDKHGASGRSRISRASACPKESPDPAGLALTCRGRSFLRGPGRGSPFRRGSSPEPCCSCHSRR